MSLSYSTDEDVVLLQSVLKCKAHLKVNHTTEIHPMKHGISKAVMAEVAVQYRSALKRPNKFPRRSNKALQHRFCRILYKYGVGELLEESGTEDNSTLRIRLLEKILRDRERFNDRKRRRYTEKAWHSSNDERSSSSCGSVRKRLCVAAGSIESPGDLMYRRQTQDLTESSLLEKQPDCDNDEKQEFIERKHTETQEPNTEQEILEDKSAAAKGSCFGVLLQAIHDAEERRRKLENHYMHLDKLLLNLAEVEDANTKPQTSERDEVLRLELMKTLLAKWELELREKELEVREKEKIWSLLEKIVS